MEAYLTVLQADGESDTLYEVQCLLIDEALDQIVQSGHFGMDP